MGRRPLEKKDTYCLICSNLRAILRSACKLQLFDCSECKWAHLRNQKLSLRRISSKYHRKFRWWLSLDEISYGYRCIVRLAPKIFHLSVSHRKFLANLIIYWWEMCLIFAINGWFRVFVAATYFAICLTPKTLHTTVSHQIIIANTAKVVQNFLIKDAWETHNDGEFINCKCFIRRKYDNVKIF